MMYGHEHKDHYNGLEKLLSKPMTDAEARAILTTYGARSYKEILQRLGRDDTKQCRNEVTE